MKAPKSNVIESNVVDLEWARHKMQVAMLMQISGIAGLRVEYDEKYHDTYICNDYRRSQPLGHIEDVEWVITHWPRWKIIGWTKEHEPIVPTESQWFGNRAAGYAVSMKTGKPDTSIVYVLADNERWYPSDSEEQLPPSEKGVE